MAITYLENLRINIDTVPIVANQLIHCTDNDESFFDLSPTNRINTGEIKYLNAETDRTGLAYTPEADSLFFVIATKLLYKYNNGWIAQTDNFAALFSDNTSLKKLTPITLMLNGKKVAPRTFLSCVYTPDGTNLGDILNDLNNNETQLKTVNVAATTNNQSVFVVPFTPPYTYISAIIYNGELLDPDSYYYQNTTPQKVVLGIDIPINQTITFVWLYTLSQRKFNAVTVNNMRMFSSRPKDPRLYDIVFNLFQRSIQQFDGFSWRNIGSAQYGLKMKTSSSDYTSSIASVPINIQYFNQGADSLFVIKDNTFLTEGVDYSISSDNTAISKISGSWEADVNNPIHFYMLCFKNIPLYDGKIDGVELADGTVLEKALCQQVIDKLNRPYVTNDDLIAALLALSGKAPASLNTLERIASSINNDANFANTMAQGFKQINDTLDRIIDNIANKFVIKVQTIDGNPVDGQTITITNNKNNTRTTFALGVGQSTITVNLDKATSYTVSVNLKTGYVTPDPVTYNSGHLGDITNIGMMYHR